MHAFRCPLHLWATLCGVLITLFLPGCPAAKTEAPRRVIWLTIDSLRADHLGYAGYGRPVSPHLDQIAKESADFRLALVPANVTRRSVVAYMCGKHYSQIHENPRENGLPDREFALAEAFKEAGFHTVGCVANYFLRPEEGLAQGFDEYETVYSYSTPAGSIEEVTGALRRHYRPSGGREFIYVHTMDVHHPYRPPIPYGEDFTKPYQRGAVKEGNIYNQDGSVVISNLPYFAESNDVQPEDIEFLISRYDGTIQHTDAQIPELLRVLQYDPDQDLLVITADHGEQFFEHGFWRHGALLSMEEIRVPLLMRCRGFKPAQCGEAVSLLDLYPTFCDLFGLRRPEGLVGKSLLPILRGAPAEKRTVYCETPDGTGPAAAAVNADYLYRVSSDLQYTAPWSAWPYEEALFDLHADPGCDHNVAGERTEAAEAMNQSLRELNPRWRNYTRQALGGSESTILLGPNLLAGAWSPETVIPAPCLKRSDDGGLLIQTGFPELKLDAAIDAPGDAYLVEVRCKLASGAVAFELVPAGGGEPIWRYECRKPSQDWKNIRCRVRPMESAMQLRIRFIEPGEAEIAPPSLRHAPAPVIPLSSAAATGKTPAEEGGLTDEARQRLETLGYLGAK